MTSLVFYSAILSNGTPGNCPRDIKFFCQQKALLLKTSLYPVYNIKDLRKQRHNEYNT